MKVTLNNFQILEGTHTFEFNNGINVIVGPNASGKSSLFYAIENCLKNPNGVSDCINYNSNKTDVTIEEGSESITWTRTVDSSCYTNNKTGQTFVKASKLDSRDIANLHFYFDNKGNVVNIHNEWSVLFPFAESDSDMFRLFEDIFNISCSFQIIDEMKKDEQFVKSLISSTQQEKLKSESKLKCLTEITDKVKLEDINYYLTTLNELNQQALDLRNSYTIYTKHSFLQNVIVPSGFDVTNLYVQSERFDQLKDAYDQYCNQKRASSITIPRLDISLDNIITTKEIHDDYEQYCVTKATIKDYLSQIQQLNEQEKQINQKIGMIKVCPTCGQVIKEQ